MFLDIKVKKFLENEKDKKIMGQSMIHLDV
jgi:hypothetical protein